VTGRLKTTVAVFGIALRNRSLLRLELAYSAFCAAEWGVWVSLVVYAYARGGATGAIALAIAVDAPSVVVAVTRAQLYTLEKGPFVFAVTGHPASERAAGEMVTRRLDDMASHGPSPLPGDGVLL
jgi:hypothetical protein